MWLNLSSGISVFSTVVAGCTATFALLQEVHSLHQANTSEANHSQIKKNCHQVLCGLPTGMGQSMDMSEDCLSLGRWNQRLRAPVEMSHLRLAPWYATISSCKEVLIASMP